jgi:hypothetical protein
MASIRNPRYRKETFVNHSVIYRLDGNQISPSMISRMRSGSV